MPARAFLRQKVDEIDICSQFHQHISSSFYAGRYSFAEKLQSQTVREKLHKTLLYEKGLSKILMKLTPGHVDHEELRSRTLRTTTSCLNEL